MNESINILAILKGKPQGTKLHDSVRGIDVYFDKVDNCNKVHCTFEEKELQMFTYSSKGTLVGFEDGMVVLLPSEEMQDWRKFAWKKGDVLVHKDGDVHIIFERFVDDTYCSFVGKYYLWKENNNTEQFYENERLLTSDFQKAGKDAAQIYINTIEKRFGGKLNRETLEIEPAQPEFKDGDILLYKSAKFTYFSSIFILCTNRNRMCSYVRYSIGKKSIDYDVPVYNLNTDRFRYATEEEKQQLFDALAKEGKAWDSEHKMIVKQLVPGNLYYFEMENELAYIAKLKEAKGGEFTFESNVSWCPRNSQNGYDYEEGSFTVLGKDCYGFREANADECKIFEKFLVEQAMKSFKFKALDYVLCKSMACYEGDAWNLFQYAYQNKDGIHIMVGGSAFKRCIPYKGNEHLLGTTKEVEG